jgi:uncharacterized protein YbjT (DUF2867 family)
MSGRILVAGATGRLGMRVVRNLHAEGWQVRALVRDPARLGLLRRYVDDVVTADLTASTLPAGVCDGIDIVFTCAGASTDIADSDTAGFDAVDHRGNARLLDAAVRADVQKFMYVTPLGAERLTHTACGAAHQRMVEALRGARIAATVVRATGHFSCMAEALRLLHAGAGWTWGTGPWRTNPIHEADLADFCCRAIDSPRFEVTVGGPATFTRAELLELARSVLAGAGRAPLPRAPRATTVWAGARIAEVMEFAGAVSRLHVEAPAHGSHRLEDYLVAAAATWRRRAA